MKWGKRNVDSMIKMAGQGSALWKQADCIEFGATSPLLHRATYWDPVSITRNIEVTERKGMGIDYSSESSALDFTAPWKQSRKVGKLG